MGEDVALRSISLRHLQDFGGWLLDQDRILILLNVEVPQNLLQFKQLRLLQLWLHFGNHH